MNPRTARRTPAPTVFRIASNLATRVRRAPRAAAVSCRACDITETMPTSLAMKARCARCGRRLTPTELPT